MLRSASFRGLLSTLKRYLTPHRSLGPLGSPLRGTTSAFPHGRSFPRSPPLGASSPCMGRGRGGRSLVATPRGSERVPLRCLMNADNLVSISSRQLQVSQLQLARASSVLGVPSIHARHFPRTHGWPRAHQGPLSLDGPQKGGAEQQPVSSGATGECCGAGERAAGLGKHGRGESSPQEPPASPCCWPAHRCPSSPWGGCPSPAVVLPPRAAAPETTSCALAYGTGTHDALLTDLRQKVPGMATES